MATSWGTASEADPCPLHERTYTPYKKVYQQAEACTLGTAQPTALLQYVQQIILPQKM